MVAIVFGSACGSSDDDVDLGSGGTGGSSGAGGSGASGGSSGSGGSGASSGGAGVDAAAGTDAGTDGGQDGSADASGDVEVDGTAGSAGGDAGADAAPNCPDPLDEPNESETNATNMAGVDDCDATKKKPGIMKLGDQDWYHFVGTDNLLTCSTNPKASVDKVGLRVCLFAQCQGGTTQVVCAQGTAHKSPANRDGCCATGGSAEVTLSCGGVIGAQNADLYVRVDQPNKDACVDYQLTYSY